MKRAGIREGWRRLEAVFFAPYDGVGFGIKVFRPVKGREKSAHGKLVFERRPGYEFYEIYCPEGATPGFFEWGKCPTTHFGDFSGACSLSLWDIR